MSGYAYKDWFRAACFLIILIPFYAHPDMPSSVFGIQGLNPWNVFLMSVVFSWAMHRRNEGNRWDMPKGISFLLLAYLAVVLLGFFRMVRDTSYMEQVPTGYIYGEYLINTIKWVVPALLLYDGCRSPERVRAVLFSIVAAYVLLALLIAKWIPPTAALDGAVLEHRSLKVLVTGMGYHRVNLSAMLAGGAWATFCSMPIWKHRRWAFVAFLVVCYGQALTAGRMGYIAWAVTGLVILLLNRPKYLLLIPILVALVVYGLPGVANRMMQGIDSADAGGKMALQSGQVDEYQMTAGRTLIWPYIVDMIKERPWIGYGREAMQRTGLSYRLLAELGESFPHPHDAYLQVLFDNGIVGAAPVLLFYLVMLVKSLRISREKTKDAVAIAVGGASLSVILAHLVSSVGSQSFYPREGAVMIWAAMALMLRVAQDYRVHKSLLQGALAR
jgi:O-antigen ligase